MSLEHRIGQLLMIRAHSDRGEDHERQVCQAVEKYQVVGLCFFQGTAVRQAELTGQYQRLSPKVPLLIAMDAELGLGMRLTHDTLSYPRALTLGAISGEDLIYQMGRDIGRQCRRLGVYVNFAPGLDAIEISPFRALIDRGLGSIMIAHLSVPSLDKRPDFNCSSVKSRVASRSAKANFGISQRDIENVQRIGTSLPVAVVHFGNPYGLKHYDGLTTDHNNGYRFVCSVSRERQGIGRFSYTPSHRHLSSHCGRVC